MEKKYLIKGFLTGLLIALISGVLYLYTTGYRIDREGENPIQVQITGMISAKSIPDGASVYLNDELITATNTSIPGIVPGKHTIKISKSGFTPWEKKIEVFPELVTDITAVLISQTPRIEPLTSTGARDPSMSPSLNSIAYFSKDDKESGVWLLPLTANRLNIFSSTPSVILGDTAYTKFSDGLEIVWAPDEKQILVQQSEENYYLVDLKTSEAKYVKDPELILKEWEQSLIDKREKFIEKLEIEEDIKKIATSPETLWSPDGKKFMYQTETNDQVEYMIYNMEKPLPVGEKVQTVLYSTAKEKAQPAFSWYADSYHLIMLEPSEKDDNKGRISLIRIDGTNKVEIYNNSLFSNKVFSAPGGDKIIVLTSFKSEGDTNLYTISIR